MVLLETAQSPAHQHYHPLPTRGVVRLMQICQHVPVLRRGLLEERVRVLEVLVTGLAAFIGSVAS